jgi:protein-L-isoaspartate(D-aspartate) O-methyltransferase
MSRSRELRRRMVELMERSGAVRSPAIRDAFLTIPRETFVPGIAANAGLDYVYADEAIVTREQDGLPTSSSSQPTIMAMMLEALDLHPGHRVLEIGLGTGYNAAILRTLVGDGEVTSVDIAPDVAADALRALGELGLEVDAVIGDGAAGHAASAPYDRIIATASAEEVPRAWRDQLAPDGIVVVPLRFDAMQLVVVLRPTATGFESTHVIPGGFMPMRPAPDAPSSTGVSVSVDVSHGDGIVTSLTVSGHGLAGLSRDARGALIGHLLRDPRRVAAPPYPIRALIWQAVMTLPGDRQILVYEHGAGTRYGLVDPDGAAALAHIRPASDEIALNDIELYGAADDLADQLLGVAESWADAGRPDLDRLHLAIDYTETDPPPWVVDTSIRDGQRWSLGWI